VGSSTGSVTLARSGFTLSGPNGPGQPIQLTTAAPNADLTVASVMLNSSLNFVAFQPIRAGFTTNVAVSSSNTAVGVITASPVSLGGNAGFAFTQFDPLAGGTTTLSINTPAGFSTPAQGTSLTATIGTAAISVIPTGPAIGKNLQQPVTILLGATAPAGGVQVTITTSSPSLLLGATNSDAGSATLLVNIPSGGLQTTVYLNALADTGSATYTVSAPGYTSKTDTIQFARSGVIVYGAFGPGFPLFATAGGAAQPVIVQVGLVDGASGTWLFTPQPVRGGISLTAGLASSSPAIGTVPSQAVIPTGTSDGIVDFTALAAGQTTVSVTQPTGLAAPSQFTSVTAQVSAP
jgi:hypothetical protein